MAAMQARTNIVWMPRPRAVEVSRSQLCSSNRETPRGKPVASSNLGLRFVSGDRETPRGKPVASCGYRLLGTKGK